MRKRLLNYPENLAVDVLWSNIGEEFIASAFSGRDELFAAKGETVSEALTLLAEEIQERYEQVKAAS